MIKDVSNWFIIISFSPISLCSLEPSVNHFTETDNGDRDDKKLYITALRRSLYCKKNNCQCPSSSGSRETNVLETPSSEKTRLLNA